MCEQSYNTAYAAEAIYQGCSPDDNARNGFSQALYNAAYMITRLCDDTDPFFDRRGVLIRARRQAAKRMCKKYGAKRYRDLMKRWNIKFSDKYLARPTQPALGDFAIAMTADTYLTFDWLTFRVGNKGFNCDYTRRRIPGTNHLEKVDRAWKDALALRNRPDPEVVWNYVYARQKDEVPF